MRANTAFWGVVGHLAFDFVPYVLFGNNDDPDPILNFAEKGTKKILEKNCGQDMKKAEEDSAKSDLLY